MMKFEASSDQKSLGYLIMIFTGIAGLFLVFLSFSIKPWSSLLVILMIGLICIAFGVLIYLDSTRTCITIDDQAIILHRAFSSSSLMLDDIKGYRIDNSGREKNAFILVTENNYCAFRLPFGLERPDELRDWLKNKYRDVDEMNYRQSEKKMLEDEHFGHPGSKVG